MQKPCVQEIIKVLGTGFDTMNRVIEPSEKRGGTIECQN